MIATSALNSKSLRLLAGFAAIVLFSAFAHAADLDEVENVEEAPIKTGEYQVTVLSSYRTTYGHFDAYGAYQGLPAGSSVHSLMNSFAGNWRYTHDWEASFSFMAVNSASYYPSGTSESSSIGSPNFQMRYHFGQKGVAHYTLHLGLAIPERYSHNSISGDPGADSGTDNIDGPPTSPTFRGGIAATHEFEKTDLRASVDLSTSYALPDDTQSPGAPDGAPSVRVQRGIQYFLSENLSYGLSKNWGLSGGFREVWMGDTTADDRDVPGTAARLFTTSIGVSYKIPDWRFLGTYQTAYPFYADAVNEPNAPSVAVAVSYDGF